MFIAEPFSKNLSNTQKTTHDDDQQITLKKHKHLKNLERWQLPAPRLVSPRRLFAPKKKNLQPPQSHPQIHSTTSPIVPPPVLITSILLYIQTPDCPAVRCASSGHAARENNNNNNNSCNRQSHTNSILYPNTLHPARPLSH
jgi:hypothetical protein